MTDNKRTHECRRKIVEALNEAKIPYATSELILENILYVVRANMEAQEAAAEKGEQSGITEGTVSAKSNAPANQQE